MGLSFCNLHVKCNDLNDITSFLSEDYRCYNISNGWVSVYEKESICDWIKLVSLGRDISKKLKVCVVAVNYLDDDELRINFISKGIIIATYSNGLEGRTYTDINKVAKLFELNKDEDNVIKYMVKMDLSIAKSVDYFSMLFGLNLYSDYAMVNSGLNPVHKNIPFLFDEINKHKKNNKIKNITKLTMQQELPGIRMYYFEEDKYNNIIRLARTNENGGYQFDNISCIQITSEGLRDVYQAVYPADTFSDDSNGIHIEYGFKQIYLLNKEDYHYVKSLNWEEFEPIVSKIYRVPKASLHKEDGFLVYGFNTYDDNRYLYKCDGENLLNKYDGTLSGETVREQVSVIQFDFKKAFSEIGRWRCGYEEAVVLQDKLIIITERLIDDRGFYKVVCFFDKELNLIRSEEFPDWRHDVTSNRFAYDEEEDKIYMAGRIIDLKQHKIKRFSGDFDDANFTIIHRDSSGKKHIINVAGSRVFVQDTDMKILSCHKVKGYILNWYIGRDGKLNFISAGSGYYDYIKKNDSAIRRYELEFLY